MRSASSAALLDAQVRMTKIVLQALEARIVSLKKVVRLRRLVVAGWVRGCARLFGVHSLSSKPFCGPGPGVLQHLRGRFLSDIHIISFLTAFVYRINSVFMLFLRGR